LRHICKACTLLDHDPEQRETEIKDPMVPLLSNSYNPLDLLKYISFATYVEDLVLAE